MSDENAINKLSRMGKEELKTLLIGARRNSARNLLKELPKHVYFVSRGKSKRVAIRIPMTNHYRLMDEEDRYVIGVRNRRELAEEIAEGHGDFYTLA